MIQLLLMIMSVPNERAYERWLPSGEKSTSPCTAPSFVRRVTLPSVVTVHRSGRSYFSSSRKSASAVNASSWPSGCHVRFAAGCPCRRASSRAPSPDAAAARSAAPAARGVRRRECRAVALEVLPVERHPLEALLVALLEVAGVLRFRPSAAASPASRDPFAVGAGHPRAATAPASAAARRRVRRRPPRPSTGGAEPSVGTVNGLGLRAVVALDPRRDREADGLPVGRNLRIRDA